VRALVCVAAVFLGGCINLPGSTPPPVMAAPAAQCPPQADYTKIDPASKPPQTYDTEFAAAAAALDAAKLPGYLIIEGYLTDYHNMRVANAKCQG
jgi:hypothetical protein